MLSTHGDEKFHPSSLLRSARDWGNWRVEHRQVASGAHQPVAAPYTELLHVISGRALVRHRADGPVRERVALPGTNWLVPAGVNETLLELEGSTECVIIYLPAGLIEDSALVDHGIDPARTGLVYEGGFADPTLTQLSMAIYGLLMRADDPLDRLFADGLRTALAAHLIGNYTAGQWRPPARQPSLEPRRLQRVLGYIEARLGETISLEDLASEACLSPYHFARLFHQAMGRPPHRYVVERRVATAQLQLRAGRASMAEVALDAGFGTQANFSRVFRKLTGLTPRQYRDM